MCGIAGIVTLDGPPPELARLRRMCDCIVHRGPDDASQHVWDNVGLGIQRLSIIDVEGGGQPIFNEDRTVRTVYNGEIYNFRELRRDLEGRGHRFATAADTEVIVHGWEEFGRDFPSRLNGMFAIALHDRRRRRFLLVRDRIGVKPLYWAQVDGHLVFGSEIKVLLASGLVAAELDVDSVGQFLGWEYVPAPRTLLRGVYKLEPGALIEIDLAAPAAAVEPRRWWDVPPPDVFAGPGADRGDGQGHERSAGSSDGHSTGRGDGRGADRPEGGSDDDWADAVEAKLAECVRRQLVADVPLGAFLSGGVDSSAMVGAMGEASTFSIGFDDPSYNELAWARRVADHLGLDHTDETIRPDVVELFERLMNHMDDPIGDFSIFPTFLVSRLARRDVKVVLSGDGGDELFGGYETYVAQQRARLWSLIPGPLRGGVVHPLVHALRPRPEKRGWVNILKRFVEGFEHDPRLGHARWRLFAGEAVQDALFTPEARGALRTPVGAHILELGSRAAQRRALDRALYVDLNSYLSDNILVKVDRMSMACSLEARVPYLDHELVELAFRVPPHLKVDGGKTKVLLKRVAARHVPPDCVYRNKQGFSIPIKNWLHDEFRPLLEDTLSRGRLEADGLFRADEVERLKREHLDGRANHSHILWSLLVFHDWRRRWGA